MLIAPAILVLSLTAQSFAERPVDERRRIVEQIASSLHTRPPTDEELATVEAAVVDADTAVKMFASRILSQSFNGTGGVALRADEVLASLRRLPLLEKHCIDALNDPDYLPISRTCAGVLARLATPMSAASRVALVALYQREPNRTVRRAALAALQKATDHDEIRQFFFDGLDDPDAAIRGVAARGLATFQSDAALTLILSRLSSLPDEPSPAFRDELVTALAAYGARALPHVWVLDNMLLSEQRSEERTFIRGAIDTIRRATP